MNGTKASAGGGPALILGLIGGLLAIVGTYLPWATVSLSGELDIAGQQVPLPAISESASGSGSTDGYALLVCGALAIGLSFAWNAAKSSGARRGLAVVVILAGLAVGGIGIYDTSQARSLASGDLREEIENQIEGQFGGTAVTGDQQAIIDDVIRQVSDALEVKVSYGLYVVIGAGVLVLIAGIMQMAQAGKVREEGAVPAAPSGSGWAPSGEGGATPPATGGGAPPPPPAPEPPAPPTE